MESSRIFVRGLPSNLDTDDFRQHFSKLADITDAKFIPRRRIGYVGFKTPADAAKAVKYYNKSFIRMSRINVELAHSIEQHHVVEDSPNPENQQVGRAQHGKGIGISGIGASTKRKRDDAGEKAKEAKLQEFLEVMQPPSKSQTWANEDLLPNASPIQLISNGGAGEDVIGSQSDEGYKEVLGKPKKPRKSERPTSPNQQASNSTELSTNGTQINAAPELFTGRTNLPASSDEEWLRSRTSRLLGLVDDADAFAARGQSATYTDPQEQATFSPEQPQNSPENVQNRHASGTAQSLEVKGEVGDHDDDGASNKRLFVRNLPYSLTNDDLRKHFEDRGHSSIEEIHLPIDYQSGKNKGIAYIGFAQMEAARRALEDLDGRALQGRLLHIIPSAPKKKSGLDEYAISKLPLKKQQQIRRKAAAASSTFNWNSMYMNADAVMASISDRLGVLKSDLVDPTSADTAIKQAQAETHVIQETKAYFSANGVNLDTFEKKERGETAILVKNFPYGTKLQELKDLFEAHGSVKRLLMPPSGVIAIVEFERGDHARSAFRSLAYTRFKESVLFLEKAPKDVFEGQSFLDDGRNSNIMQVEQSKPLATDLLENPEPQRNTISSTLFVRNLSFSTTSSGLSDLFKPLDGFLSARVKTRLDPKDPRKILSMGFGFVEFRTKQQAEVARTVMDGHGLDGHKLLVRASSRAIDAAEERRRADNAAKAIGRKTKIIIKNLPFEASKKEVRSLFGSYGQLRSVRVPKKIDNSTRGFAFADFVTVREAENAINALKDTHLLGRRLVLDFAAEDEVDPEQEIEKMKEKAGKQANKVALQRLTSSSRKKFNLEGDEGPNGD
ncbi:MAG: hypothetical protein Q9167_005012 [Letrouitia subvulpina]